MIRNTVSQTWRLGRAVALANKQANVGNVGGVLVEALGGDEAAKVLFAGKIVDVGRRLFKGHSIGEIVIQALTADEEEGDDPDHPRLKFGGTLTSECAGVRDFTEPSRKIVIADLFCSVPFKNENLLCEHKENGNSKVSSILS